MKRLKHPKFFSFAMLGVVAVALAGCSQQSSSNTPRNKTVAVSSKDVISTMDSSLNTDQIGSQNLNNTMEGLYRYRGKQLKPAMATSIAQPTNNGTVYNINLRHAKWSNGDPVTAHDFVYAWRRIVDPKTGSQYSYIYSGIKNADAIVAGKKKPDTLGIKALGDHQLQITLEHPIPYFNTLVTGSQFLPINQRSIKKAGNTYGISSKEMAFNGPYKLVNWKVGDTEWTEVKNHSYWNAHHVQPKAIKYYTIKDPNTGLNLYDTNQMDRYQDISGDSARQLSNRHDFGTDLTSSTFYIEMNQKKLPYFKNAKLRQAISLTINRDELSNNVLGKTGTASHSIVPRDMTHHKTTGTDFVKEPSALADQQYTSYNPKKATKLWQEGLQETGQKELNLTMTTDDTDTAKKQAEYLQNSFEKNLPGLKVTISSVPFKTRIQRQSTHDFDLIVAAWNADYPDPTNFMDLFTTGNPQNDGQWSNKEYDHYVKAAETTDINNPELRWKDMLQAQHIITKEQGVIPLYQVTSASLTKSNVHNFKITPTGLYDMASVIKN
ncbi:peptide ABC transporter substrate-binding protein [Fructilactobacillus florum]|uniref:Oligopeptide ABC transporter, substrate-binding lipoprotein n=1 Tax=Fructilactobacillus florum DSM 22689 = JCM 16035 TaxID=1423745 RepID=A0A0R2CPN6_9LACO|nr:peptide ABC transporter substrate-binding protein [Fructilactobacillus florum]KRM90220.1 oligopeptide ABC transporter, substrate-binding lipoprotein precursor [Fructilactobacillus florum DSM 22689 = JCM 16035]